MRTGQAAVSGLSDRQPPGSRAIAVALPMVQGGTVRYVLGARMGEAVWQRLATTASTPEGGHASIYDAQQRLISYSLGVAAPAGTTLPRDAAESMQDGAAGVHRSSDVDGRIVYAAWQTVPMSGWRVRVTLAAGPIEAAHRKAIIAALSTSGASLLIGLLLASLVARRIAGPLQQLATRGPAGLPGRVPVHEVALLRDALLRAKAQDAAVHGSLQAKAQEFETLFNSSPIGMAFAQDPALQRDLAQRRPWTACWGRCTHQDSTVRVLHQGQLLPLDQQPLQRAAALGETIAGMELEIVVEGRAPTFVIANAVAAARCRRQAAWRDQRHGRYHPAQGSRGAPAGDRPAAAREPAPDGARPGGRPRGILPLPVRRRPAGLDTGPVQAVRGRRSWARPACAAGSNA